MCLEALNVYLLRTHAIETPFYVYGQRAAMCLEAWHAYL
jgi:hypothetical protein